MRIVTAVMLGLALTSIGACAHRGPRIEPEQQVQAMMDSWKGKRKAELIQQWGPAHRIDSDGQGGEVMSYFSQVNGPQTPGAVYRNPLTGQVNYTAPQQQGYERVRQFYVGKDGLIYGHRWQGL